MNLYNFINTQTQKTSEQELLVEQYSTNIEIK